jgi:hypothetical protein
MAAVAHQVQPSDPGRDQRHDDQRRRDGMQAMTPAWLATIFAVLWLAIGGFAVYGGGADSYQYNGFPPPHDPPGVSSGSLKTLTFHTALGQTRTYCVHLRPGHPADTAHGRDESFVLDVVATRLWRAQTAAMLRWASNAMAA